MPNSAQRASNPGFFQSGHRASDRLRRLWRRRARRGGGLGLGVLAVLLLASVTVLAQERLVFDVLRDGEAVGEQSIEFEREDEGLKVSVETALAVKRAFFTVFRYEHKRVERWRDGRLVSLAGMTNDDGEEMELSIVLKDKAYTRTFNGEDEQLNGSLGIASLWSKEVLSGGKLLSAESDAVYRVRADLLGRETIRVGSGDILADHYRLSGQLSRDLWYDDQGRLAQVRYEHDGYVFEFLRR